MTSTQDPVTVFGAKVPVRSGWTEVSETLRWLAARWSDSTDYRFDLVAADVSGDMAYVVGFEHCRTDPKPRISPQHPMAV
jgi:ketosteroid isomerase-like protein